MEGELKPRHNETIIINGSGELRVVPVSFTRNKRVMNAHGWRVYTPPQIARPSKPEEKPIGDQGDNFQEVNTEHKTGPGGPKKN